MTGSPCQKIEFASRAEANEYIRIFARSRGRSTYGKMHGSWRAYKCRVCSKWHMTSASKAEERQHRKKYERRKKKAHE
jgi:hypothetical protein